MFTSVSTGRRARRAIALLLCVSLLAPIAGPAFAWKPKTHVYLAELAMRDAVDDGRVTIYQTEYQTGRILGTLGEFEVRPEIVAALRANPDQYLAGVIGPDAYPDLMTGQQIIHPGSNHSLLGSPAHNEPASVEGTDAWLTYLWRLAYGRKDPNVERLRAALNRGIFGEVAPPTDTPPIRAFVAGYLTHAAGDMFMHTFVNHYTGGDFAIAPDPKNALKHVVLEGYVGKRTPSTHARTSIEGVDDFIYRYMIRAYPDSVLNDRLLRGAGTKTSIPAIFSTLRNGLQRDVERYDRERLERSGPSRVAYATANGPAAEYKRAWIEDIDRGLRAWPAVSHQISLALVYNPDSDGADIARAREVASAYVGDHLLSMAGAPDAVVATVQFIKGVIDAILPDIMLAPLEALKRALLDWLVKEATGMTVDEIKDYLNHPETTFDRVMNAPGGGYGGREPTLTTLAAFNRDALKIDDPGAQYMDRKFEVDRFAPAFNTLQMTKLLFLSEKGMADLLAALRAKGLTVPEMPTGPVAYENAMLGFLTSMDGDNRWQGLAEGTAVAHGRAFFLARGRADAWRNLFMRQIGERADWPAAAVADEGPLAAADDTGFETIEWWAARVDDVKYDNEAGRSVSVTMTFRNDSNSERTFSNRIAEPVRALLNVDRGGRTPLLRMEYVHPEDAGRPQWHYAPHGPIPPKGRVSVRFVFDVGDSVRQRLVHSISIVERRPGRLPSLQLVDGPSKDFDVPRLNLNGTVGAPPPPPALPAVVTDLEQLRKFEGLYRTSFGTNLTLAVAGEELTGEAMSVQRPSPRELVKVKLYADGVLRGSMRDPTGQSLIVWYDLALRFDAGGQRFSGEMDSMYDDGQPPRPYTGVRLGDVGTDPNKKVLPAGFVEAGYFALRLDAVVATDAVTAVTMTAHNYQGGRQGLQYNDNRFVLVGSNGTEYRTDGNTYGTGADNRLTHTVWLEEEEQAALTYVFPPLPPGVSPARLLVKDASRDVTTLDLTRAPAERVATAQKADAPADGGGPIVLGAFEASLESISRGLDRDWETVIAFTNVSGAAVRLGVNDIGVSLHGANGDARQANGNFYVADDPGRRPEPSGGQVAPGQTVRIRFWHPQSAAMTPTRYRLREQGAEPRRRSYRPTCCANCRDCIGSCADDLGGAHDEADPAEVALRVRF